MVKDRLIFTLLLNDGIYMLSRNFKLQHLGDLQWIKDCYDFNSIALSIDELVVLNVSRGTKDTTKFLSALSDLIKNCFMPIAVGGGINSLETAYQMFDSGADKIVVNTGLFRNPDLIRSLVETFGGQSIIASIDYKSVDDHNFVFIENGSLNLGLELTCAIKQVVDLGVGEIYLTSINRDGTGLGYDLDTFKQIVPLCPIPIIASGGVGRYDQLVDGIRECNLTAVSTANIFAFMADGLTEARIFLKDANVNLASWDKEMFHSLQLSIKDN